MLCTKISVLYNSVSRLCVGRTSIHSTPIAFRMALQASSGSVPTSGHNYIVNNVGSLHVLDDFDSSLADGTPILATAAGANRINQIVRMVILSHSMFKLSNSECPSSGRT